MCGIFGFISQEENSNASETVLTGLKTLEYRGYDSWGVASLQPNGQFIWQKRVGKIGNAVLDQKIKIPTKLSLGHTRWATHGGVTQANAHPHISCDGKLALVHNGIIENFQELRKRIDGKHNIKSETDTEIVLHLLEDEIEEKNLGESLTSVFSQISGLNAIVVASGQEIGFAKNGSPLLVGLGEKEMFIASDPTGILPYTKKVIFIEDNQIGIINSSGIRIWNAITQETIKPEIQVLDWDADESDLGKYPHYFLKEIYDQPKVLASLAENLSQEAEKIAAEIKKAEGTFFIGAGTAYNACIAGTYLFSKIAKHHVNTTVASEFNYLEDFLTNKSLIIALSQSGETIDVIEPLNRAKTKGSKIVGVVNVLGSTIYRMADEKVLLGAGPELAVCSTKAYVAKLAFILMLSYALVGKVDQGKNLVLNSVKEVKRLLEEANIKKVRNIVKILNSSDRIYAIGRGLSYPTALEAALKIKEVSYIPTEGLAGGELKHHTIALFSEGTPCLVFAPNDETYSAIISNATELKSRGAIIIGIGPKNESIFDHWVEVKDCGEASTISSVIPAQLFGYYLAVERGLDPDKPRNLAKSVTVK